MRKWAVWIPVLMVASMLYWTVALGLGGLSLMVFGLGDCASELELADDFQVELDANVKDSYGLEAAGRGIPVELVEDPGQGPGQAAAGSAGAGAQTSGHAIHF